MRRARRAPASLDRKKGPVPPTFVSTTLLIGDFVMVNQNRKGDSGAYGREDSKGQDLVRV
jgi:hypothetical protein